MSKQIRPNQPLVVHVSVSIEDEGAVEVGDDERETFVVVLSSHPPNQPGCLQLDEGAVVGRDEVVVSEGAGAGLGVFE